MDILGIGNMELVVILLVALLVLGPARMVDMARTLGRFWGEAQRTVRYAIDAATVDEAKTPSNTPPREAVPGPEDVVARPSRSEADDEPSDGTGGEAHVNGHSGRGPTGQAEAAGDEPRRAERL